MSDLERAALGLIAGGLLGAASMLLYLRACIWAEWELLPARYHRRSVGWQRRAPVLIAGSAAVAGLGLLLGLTELAVG
jgi:hypothetical protein